MTATIHKIVAGTGYLYYLRRVAAHDDPGRGRSALADYYSARGESPGRWLGSGLAALGIAVGEEVTEAQMRNLLGIGVHPNAERVEEDHFDAQIGAGAKPKDARRDAQRAAELGSRFRVYPDVTDYRKRCGQAFAAHNIAHGAAADTDISDDTAARIRTEVAQQMFTEQYRRGPLDERELSAWVAYAVRPTAVAVAGFDVCFSPTKSFSVLWAVAPKAVADKLELAHRRAVGDALEWLETRGIYTRLGRNGVRQVDVEGVVAMAFEHRASRAGDPDLHTHVPIANRVRVRDGPSAGAWRTLDGAALYQVVVAVSEIYNTRLEHHSEDLVGVEFADRPGTDPPIRDIVGVAPALMRRWSSRDAAITAHLDAAAAAFQQAMGREPTAGEVYELTQRAILATRPAKPPQRTRAEERQRWRAEAIEELGSRAAVAGMVAEMLDPVRPARPAPSANWIAATAARVVAAVSAKRAIWRPHHITAETQRQLRGAIAPRDWPRLSRAVEDAALRADDVIALGDPDAAVEPGLRATPAMFRRRDHTLLHTRAGTQIYTSTTVLGIEARLVALATRRGGRTLAPGTVAAAIDRYTRAHPDRPLLAGQIALIEAFATSELRIRTADAPAGSGKTTAMRVLTDAWHDSGGSVLGLAPTATAAAILGESIGARAETVDRLLHVLSQHVARPDNPAQFTEHPPPLPDWVHRIGTGTLVIVDEHVLLPDRKRLRLLQFLDRVGATVRCVGDTAQLPAIDAGGAYADMAAASPEPPLTLTHVVRFADPREATASLSIRAGDPLALGWYLDEQRVHGGHRGSSLDDAYTAWRADIDAGRDAVMLAATHRDVTELNRRARDDRRARDGTEPGPECVLADELRASIGDVIRTRENAPRLRFGLDDWVRNGYLWTVNAVGEDGSITATHRRDGRDTGHQVVLPADYVAAHVHLGYATTIDSAQGITTDTAHVALTGAESRQQLYVALTRGRYANHLYLATALAGAEGDEYGLGAAWPRTAVEVLTGILDRDRHAKSAHTTLREALEPRARLGHALDIYLDTVAIYAENTVPAQTLAAIDSAAEAVRAGLSRAPAWPVLRAHLALLSLTGTDPVIALHEAAAERELDTADDPAAVLDWRLDHSGEHSGTLGPLPFARVWPHGIDLTTSPDLAHIAARSAVVTALADEITATAHTWTGTTAPAWARPFLDTDRALLADLAVWRAALHVPDTDLTPTGPRRYPVRERRHQSHLDTRVHAAIGDPNRPAHRWQPCADTIDTRLTDDPSWPVIADRIDTAARSGLPITTMLTTAAGTRPLPDELPAAALWARLDLEPAGLDAASGPLRPAWTTQLATILGADTAAHVLADTAWPRLVAAVDTGIRHGWTPTDLLTTAHELILTATTDDTPPLRPHQLATALTWRIDALLHADTTPEETPMPEPEPTPEPGPTRSPHEHTLAEIAALLHAGHLRQARTHFTAATARLSDEQRDILHRITETLYRYPYTTAVARLRHAAAHLHPDHADLITACIPDTDPHTYQPPPAQPAQPVQPHTRRTAPDRRRAPRDPAHTRAEQDTQQYFDRRADIDDRPGHYPIPDTWHEERYYRAPQRTTGVIQSDQQRYPDTDAGPDTDRTATAPARHLPCVDCGLDRPRIDSHPQPPRRSDDGLCGECRDLDRPAIPDHDPKHHIAARCTHLASLHPPEQLIGLLHRDWRIAAPDQRAAITTWIDTHPRYHPLRRLTDHELHQRITELEQHLALAGTDDYLYSPANPPTPTTDDDRARQAIRAARTAEHRRDLAEQRVLDAAAEIAHHQRALDTTLEHPRTHGNPNQDPFPDRHRTDRELLQRALDDATRRHQQRLQTRTAARRHAHRTHQQATLLAGAPDTWDDTLTRTTPTARPTHTDDNLDDIRDRLDTLHRERRRRDNPTSPNPQSEDPAQLQASPEYPDPEPNTTAPHNDHGLAPEP
ncbi:relaxase domain-containing protein [Nocardia puris]|uniref:Conjugative relaxase-like TrwC/TraI family protein n=1 Tax=Nocardia puris TaxID=208602 RepID=A0A366D540_9NOCA|nr:MobF family relaxase [Nocardia puris]MBF6370294.1 relaxase domain-containing protein [Nocardia puris]RBO85161.1 conjugative relaxase-like TrwC/TraI family protein [Nocardia puris]